jgi:sulfite exporter TauE/SafE
MGWGPCLALTCPLLLPYIGATKRNWQGGLKIGFIFSLGRIMSLVILGASAAIAFSFINRFFPPFISAYLYLIIAFFMVTLGILIILGKGIKLPLGKIIEERILNSGTVSMLGLGFLVGILPCVPLISVLTYIACITTNIGWGILYVVLFGIGTAIAPMVLGALIGLVSERLLKLTKLYRIFQVACGLVLILFGIHLIYYVWNLII